MLCFRDRYLRAAVMTYVLLTVMTVGISQCSSIRGQIATSNEDPFRSLALEVLINNEGSEYDLSPLDDGVEEGYVSMIEVDLPTLNEELSNGVEMAQPLTEPVEYEVEMPPGRYYVYRDHTLGELAVVITEINDTAIVDPFIPDTKLKGLSISLVVPSRHDLIEMEVLRSSLLVLDPMDLTDNISYLMEGKGYSTHHLRTQEGEFAGFEILKGDIKIYIFNEPTDETEHIPMERGIFAEIPPEQDQGAMIADIEELLSLAGLDPDSWNRTFSPGQIWEEGTVLDLETQPEDLDIGGMIVEELRWLIDKGIISGITKDDMDDISEISELGLSGLSHRIVHYDGSWKRFEDVGLLPFLGGGPEDGGVYSRFFIGEDDLPPLSSDGKQDDGECISYSFLWILLPILMLLILAPALYAHHRRKNLLNNLNRKTIFETIREDPGIYFSEIQRIRGLKQGVLSYHLNLLENNEMIKSIQVGKYRRFYLFDEKIEFKFKMHDLQIKIIDIVTTKPGISQSKISRQLGRNRMVINYHIRILFETGIIYFEREGRETHCFVADRATF